MKTLDALLADASFDLGWSLDRAVRGPGEGVGLARRAGRRALHSHPGWKSLGVPFELHEPDLYLSIPKQCLGRPRRWGDSRPPRPPPFRYRRGPKGFPRSRSTCRRTSDRGGVRTLQGGSNERGHPRCCREDRRHRRDIPCLSSVKRASRRPARPDRFTSTRASMDSLGHLHADLGRPRGGANLAGSHPLRSLRSTGRTATGSSRLMAEGLELDHHDNLGGTGRRLVLLPASRSRALTDEERGLRARARALRLVGHRHRRQRRGRCDAARARPHPPRQSRGAAAVREDRLVAGPLDRAATAGSTWYADNFALELHRHCVAAVNIDSPGCRGRYRLRRGGLDGRSRRGGARSSIEAVVGDRAHQAAGR